MAYYLTIANKGEYKKLNLLLLEGFIKTSKFKGEALSLDELDDLTSKYQDEYEFKKKLYQAGIISIDEITKELSIRRKQNNNLIKDYELEKTIENKRYDGFIPEYNILIEMHGEQHYRQMGKGKSLQEEQKNDKYKKQLALSLGFEEQKYLQIDCRKSNFDFIKDNILSSDLGNIFDLSSINWSRIDSEIVEDTIMEDIIKLWNEGYCNKEIREKLKIKSKTTVKKYLKIGARKGLCNYTIEESRKRSSTHCGKSIKIYCETNNKIYNTKKELRINSEKDFGVKLGIKLINRMLERPLDTDIIKIAYVEGGEIDE